MCIMDHNVSAFNITTPINNHAAVEHPSHQNSREVFIASELFVSNEAKTILELIVDFALISLLCLTGFVGNIVTIAVFHRQGYKDTINISLTAIAIWDLIKCFCGALYRTRGPIKMISSPSFATSYDTIVSFFFAYPSFYCTYASSVLAAYVAVERCLCVSLPFTVKSLLTPKVATTTMAVLSIVTFGSVATMYTIKRFLWVFHPGLNATIAVRSYTSTSLDHNAYLKYYGVISFVWPVLSFAVQCFCTYVISAHLRKASTFRSQISGSAKDDSGMSRRDRQVNRMLLVVLLVYIVCLFPRISFNIAKTAESEFYMFKQYHNLFASCFYFVNLFDFANASVNCIIYYFMSSQFRASLRDMIGPRKIKQKQ